MTRIEMTIAGAKAWASVTGALTSGMVGIPVTIQYDEEWNGLTKNLLCRCGREGSDRGEQRTILNAGTAATVAHEVMKSGMHLFLGVEGYTPDGRLVIPTTWADCGEILCGANSGEDAAADPTPPIWNQLQTEIIQIKGNAVTKENLAEVRACTQAAVQAADAAGRAVQAAATNASRAEAAAVRAESFAASADASKEVTVSVAVASESVILDSTAPEQTVNLAWTVENARTVPAFANYYIPNDSHPMPKEFATTGYTNLFGGIYGNQAAFVQGHQYFQAMHYRMDGDSTATLHSAALYPSPEMKGSGWIYGLATPPGVAAANLAIKNTNTGTGVIDYLYCIDITAMQEAGLVAEGITLAELAELFGGLELLPGQDYPGGTIGNGTATLSIDRGGQISTVDNSSATATVKGGDTLSVEGGSVTFLLKVLKMVAAGDSKEWEGVVVVNVGDSLTDPEINADRKYPDLIAEKQGNTVVNMGKGGTGYWRGHEDGNAFYQRMANVPSNADVVTVFGSINDWRIALEGVEIGTASDTIEAGTLAGYINECVNVIQAKAPYAQVALITAMPYHGIREDIQESLANIIVEVARYRKIKCLDLYHESGFRVDDPVFAQVYCTDYSATADTYGHPSNLAHERIIAPEFMQLLRRMIW